MTPAALRAAGVMLWWYWILISLRRVVSLPRTESEAPSAEATDSERRSRERPEASAASGRLQSVATADGDGTAATLTSIGSRIPLRVSNRSMIPCHIDANS